MNGDRDSYRTASAGAVLLVAAIAAVISYEHILTLAIRYGQPAVAAYLLPLSIDGAVLTSSLAMLRSARFGISAPWLARGMLALSVGATLACNVAYGLPHGWPGALLSGWPAVAFIGSAEVAICMSRRAVIAQLSESPSGKSVDPVIAAQPVPVIAPQPVPVIAEREARVVAAANHRAPAKRRTGKSRRGGSIEARQARRAQLEAETVALLAAEPGIGTTALAQRLDVSVSTAQRLKGRISATESAI